MAFAKDNMSVSYDPNGVMDVVHYASQDAVPASGSTGVRAAGYFNEVADVVQGLNNPVLCAVEHTASNVGEQGQWFVMNSTGSVVSIIAFR